MFIICSGEGLKTFVICGGEGLKRFVIGIRKRAAG